MAAMQEKYTKNRQEKADSLGKDKIGSSSTATLNILVDNDAPKSLASEAIMSDSK